MNDTPQITTSAYASTLCDPGSVMWGAGSLIDTAGGAMDMDDIHMAKLFRNNPIRAQQQKQTETMDNNITRRFVQVFIADPNINVPLDESVLFKGEQKLTDLTDTELFFEVPIAETLKAHNDKRIKWTDKEASKRAGKDVFLDPVRIRELKMVVVTIAQF